MTTPAVDDWSGLGFNPVPGDPGTVEQLSKTLVRAAQHLSGVNDTLKRLGTPDGTWSGDAQQAFSASLSDLPTHLQKASDSVDRARQELDNWWKELTANRVTATGYEAQAKTMQGTLRDAQAAHREAGANGDLLLAGQTFPDAAALASAQQRYNTAKSTLDDAATRLTGAQNDLNGVLTQAHQLSDEQAKFGRERAKAIRKAADDDAPHKPGIWDWIKAHGADFLTVAASVCGIIAIFCPAFALAAIILSVAAFAAHSATYVSQGGWGALFPPSAKNMGNWLTLGGDALGAIPGVGVAGKGLAAAKAARTAGEAGLGVKAGLGASRYAARGIDPANPLTKQLEKALGKKMSGSAAMNASDAAQATVMGGLTLPTALSLDPSLNNSTLGNWVNGTTAAGNAVNSVGYTNGGGGKAAVAAGTLGILGNALGFGWSLAG